MDNQTLIYIGIVVIGIPFFWFLVKICLMWWRSRIKGKEKYQELYDYLGIVLTRIQKESEANPSGIVQTILKEGIKQDMGDKNPAFKKIVEEITKGK